MRGTKQHHNGLRAATTTASQHNALGTSQLQHKEPDIRHAGHNKTQTTMTHQNALRARGPSHDECKSQHVYSTRQPRTRQRQQQHKNPNGK